MHRQCFWMLPTDIYLWHVYPMLIDKMNKNHTSRAGLHWLSVGWSLLESWHLLPVVEHQNKAHSVTTHGPALLSTRSSFNAWDFTWLITLTQFSANEWHWFCPRVSSGPILSFFCRLFSDMARLGTNRKRSNLKLKYADNLQSFRQYILLADHCRFHCFALSLSYITPNLQTWAPVRSLSLLRLTIAFEVNWW